MKLSLVATVRNERGTIRAFIKSLLEQELAPDEIVIVDGASTDGTLEILEEYERHGEITLISKPCNIAQGRNLGVAAAKGSYIAVTDAGCQLDASWLKKMADCFRKNPDVEVVAGNFRFEIHTPFEDAVVRATFQPRRDNTDTARYYPSSRSVAFTKAAWERAGGYPEWLYAAEDTLFNIRLRQIGCRFVFCQDAIVRWRPRESWKALARQRINFSRGNARVGIGTAGYLINLRTHGIATLLFLAGIWFLPSIAAGFALLGWHIRRHLWRQVIASTPTDTPGMRLRVLAIMEFVRVVSIYGFLRGRLDRLTDPSYEKRQIDYMGVSSVRNLDFFDPLNDFRKKDLPLYADRSLPITISLVVISGACGITAWLMDGGTHLGGFLAALAVALAGTVALLLKSISHFTHTGPRLREEILTHYRRYTLFALVRLSFYTLIIMLFTSCAGVLLYYMLNLDLGYAWSNTLAVLAAATGILGASMLQFIRKLRFNPGLLVASIPYRMSRFYGLWRRLTPPLIYFIEGVLLITIALLFIDATKNLIYQERFNDLIAVWATLLFYGGTIIWVVWQPEARPPRPALDRDTDAPPNILMIGSDTLRADRLSALGYHRMLTPNIDEVAKRGILFANCYVPCARTAPSLVSLLTGTWPHSHGIRDNFVFENNTRLTMEGLPKRLKSAGYHTAVISDWCGSDMGKFSLGFDYTDLPADQWNLKYLIRQGPKDLRLFVSLFTHNRLGRLLLPEIYYLGGVPLTQQMGKRARRLVSRLAESAQPFFLNVFYSTTHPPFASEWPWYMRFAEPDYTGESKFAMARLTDPFEIISRQGAPKDEFDLDQVINLYDGCVAEFDNEVGKMLEHLQSCGLAYNTIVAIYSDHGMEFFEHETWGQGNSAVGDFSARIPLIIADPRRPREMTVDDVIRSIDFAPTLLALVGIDSPTSMEGVSLADYWGERVETIQLDAYNETGIWFTKLPGTPEDHLRYPDLLDLLEVSDKDSGTLSIKSDYRNVVVEAKDRMLRRGRWKLVYQPLEHRFKLLLFDILADPACSVDISQKHPEVVSELWRTLRYWIDADAGHITSETLHQSTTERN